VILYEALRQRRRDAAPPETRTPRPPAPLQIPEAAADDGEFAEGDEDVVVEAEAPVDRDTESADTRDGVEAHGEAAADADIPQTADVAEDAGGSTQSAATDEPPAPKKRAARPRATKKKTDS
jgi:hypothetical protein